MSVQLNHMLSKIENNLTFSGTLPHSRHFIHKRNDLVKENYLNSTRYINTQSSVLSARNETHKEDALWFKVRSSGKKSDRGISESELCAFKREINILHKEFQEEIREVIQSLQAQQVLIENTSDAKFIALNKEIIDVKDTVTLFQKDQHDINYKIINLAKHYNNKHYYNNSTRNNNQANSVIGLTSPRSEDVNNSNRMYLNTVRSNKSRNMLYEENNNENIIEENYNYEDNMRQEELSYRIKRNNENIKALNQNFIALMKKVKNNTEHIHGIDIAIKQNEERFSKEFEIQNLMKKDMENALEQSKTNLSKGLQNFALFHQEQNKLNDIMDKTIQKLYKIVNEEKLETELNNQIVEDNFNIINPIFQSIKNIPYLEQDIPQLTELRKSLISHGQISLSSSFFSHNNNRNNIASLNKSHGTFEDKTPMNLNNIPEDQIETSSHLIKERLSPIIDVPLLTESNDNISIANSLNIKYYPNGYISQYNASYNNKSQTIKPTNPQTEEFNLDKSSNGTSSRKAKKSQSIRNTINLQQSRSNPLSKSHLHSNHLHLFPKLFMKKSPNTSQVIEIIDD